MAGLARRYGGSAFRPGAAALAVVTVDGGRGVLLGREVFWPHGAIRESLYLALKVRSGPLCLPRFLLVRSSLSVALTQTKSKKPVSRRGKDREARGLFAHRVSLCQQAQSLFSDALTGKFEVSLSLCCKMCLMHFDSRKMATS